MASTYTPNKVYELQGTGENTGTWGTLLNAVLSIIDLNLGGRLALDVTGASDHTLTAVQERNTYILMTGVVTGNKSVIFTASNGGFYFFDNRSTGSFTITAKPSGGTGVVIPQNSKCLVMIDPSNTRAVLIDLAEMMTTRGDILYRDANGAQRRAIGTSGKALVSDGTDPTYTTAVSIAGGGTGQVTNTAAFNALSPQTTRGDMITRDATNDVRIAVGTANQTLVSNGTDPAWGTLPIAGGGTGQVTATAAFNALSPTTTRGDIITQGATNDQRLAVGAANRALISDGTDPAWGLVSLSVGVTSTLPIANGGTGQTAQAAAFDALGPTTTRGDLIYRGASNNVRLAVGSTANSVLRSDGTDPAWSVITPQVVVTLTDGATPALNAALGNTFTLTTTTNPTIAVPSNATSGQRIIIAITASGGARTASLNTGAGGFKFGSDITALSQIASGKTDYIGAIYSAATSLWNVVGYVKGY